MKFYFGDKVRVDNNTTGHTVPNGTICTVLKDDNGLLRVMEINYQLRVSDVEFQSISRKDVEKKLGQIQNEMDELLVKMEFLNENNKNEIDCREYKTYAIKKIIENNSMTLDRKQSLIFNILENGNV